MIRRPTNHTGALFEPFSVLFYPEFLGKVGRNYAAAPKQGSFSKPATVAEKLPRLMIQRSLYRCLNAGNACNVCDTSRKRIHRLTSEKI